MNPAFLSLAFVAFTVAAGCLAGPSDTAVPWSDGEPGCQVQASTEPADGASWITSERLQAVAPTMASFLERDTPLGGSRTYELPCDEATAIMDHVDETGSPVGADCRVVVTAWSNETLYIRACPSWYG